MQSRAVRVTACVIALLALGGAAFFVYSTQQQFRARKATVRQFDLRAHDAAASIASARASQRGYVAPGQSSSVWMPQVKALANQAAGNIDQMRALATTTEARRTLLEAAASVAEFITIDQRAADYIAADQPLMASDVVFSDGTATAAEVEQQIQAAWVAEAVALDAEEGAVHRRQAYAAAAAAALAAIVLVALGTTGRAPATGAALEAPQPAATDSLDLRPVEAASAPAPLVPAVDDGPGRDALALAAAAEVCTAFGCVQDGAGLKRVLGQAAQALDADGLVVWLGSADGADLRAVVAHGYSEHVLSLMRPVARQADNAAAAAYRTAALQIVPAKPGTSLGAIVAPIMSADGCIGALTAEVRDNGEVSDTLHAVAAIFASQLAAVLAPAAAPAGASRAASA
jgi:CHASE3 domain sensor protein